MRLSAWRKASAEFRDRVKRSPTLWLVPVGSVAAAHLIHAAAPRGPAAMLASFAVYLLLNALFAEIWTAADGGFDDDRFFKTAILFLSALPLLAAVLFATESALDGALRGGNQDAIMAAARLQLYGLKTAVFASTVLGAFCASELAGAKIGAFDAVPRGARLFVQNLGLAVALIAAAALLENGAGRLWTAWRAGAYEAGPREVAAAQLLKAFISTATTMFVLIAVPLHSRASGLLERA